MPDLQLIEALREASRSYGVRMGDQPDSHPVDRVTADAFAALLKRELPDPLPAWLGLHVDLTATPPCAWLDCGGVTWAISLVPSFDGGRAWWYLGAWNRAMNARRRRLGRQLASILLSHVALTEAEAA